MNFTNITFNNSIVSTIIVDEKVLYLQNLFGTIMLFNLILYVILFRQKDNYISFGLNGFANILTLLYQYVNTGNFLYIIVFSIFVMTFIFGFSSKIMPIITKKNISKFIDNLNEGVEK